MKKNMYYLGAMAVLSLCSCASGNDVVGVDATKFQSVIDGKEVNLYTLTNDAGMTVQITNFGGRVVSIYVPDKDGRFDDVALGHSSLEEYVNYEGERYVGCAVGRYANRIANGHFEIDGIGYNVPINNNGQSLHGGEKGFDLVVWDIDSVGSDFIRLKYLSKDGDEGYPGNLSVTMTYKVSADNALNITYEATTDKPTMVNLTNHIFFNLKGECGGSINDHLLTIDADYITPVDSVLIPTGEMMAVKNTPFDFRKPTAIGDRVGNNHKQLKNGAGYDHNWVLKNESRLQRVARVDETSTGRFLEVYTDQPGLQFYGGNFFDGKGKGKCGDAIRYREAFALETQKFPDSPNQPTFPSARLNPGDTYRHTCVYKFGIR
ncbi:MAG: galactose mutarotase [bacterium]|nr:galactose mutarotase [bacterium]